MFYAGYGVASGRWLLPAVLRLGGDFSLPWVLGLVSVLCLAAVACVSVEILGIRRPLGCVGAAAVLVTFPAVAATFGYMFTSGAYFLSLLLAALGALLALRRGLRGSLAGALLLTLSLGIYQAYLPVAAVLLVGGLLRETLEGEEPFRRLLLKGLRLALTLAAALAAYLLLVKLTTRETGLTDYEGLNEMGRLSLRDLPWLIYISYRKYFYFFWRNDWSCQFPFLKYGFLLLAAGSLAAGIEALRRKRPGGLKTALALGLAALYPLAGCLIYVMTPKGYVHIHMLYGMAYVLLLPILLLEQVGPKGEGRGEKLLRPVLGWVLLLTLGLTAWSWFLTDNEAYLKADLAMRQCSAWSNRLLERVEACEGYDPEMKVVLVGSDQREPAMDPTPEAESARLVGIFNLGDLRTYSTYRHFLRYYLGFTGTVFTGDSQTAREYEALQDVRAMSLYPGEGSVKVVEGAVVVRIN